jgi:hypothetical protein
MFCCILEEGTTDTYKKIQKEFEIILYHMLNYLRATNTL